MTNKLILLLAAILCLVITSPSQEGPSEKALKALTGGDFTGAIRVLDKDIAEGKNLYESYKMRAHVMRMTGNFNGAFADIGRALDIRSTEGQLYEMRAELRLFLGHDHSEILNDLNLAISNGIKHERIYDLRGMIRKMSGDIDGGIEDYETAIRLDPESPKPYVGLASAYSIKGDEPRSIKILEEFITSLESSDKRVKSVDGKVVATTSIEIPSLSSGPTKVGQDVVVTAGEATGPMSPEAARRMSAHLERSKNTAAAYINLAQLYQRAGQNPKALETVEKGIAIDRSNDHGIGVRGTIKVWLKDYRGAIADLNTGLSRTQRNADFFLHRGLANLALGKEADAEKDFEKFLTLAPKGRDRLEKLRAEMVANATVR
jgi:tetratricopeptide (TPR) repeat protein